MLDAYQRGGARPNISEMYSPIVDLTPMITKRVMDTIDKGTWVVSDKIEFRYHKTIVAVSDNGAAMNVPFYPLDKTLTQEEIEEINLHVLGYVPFENTVIQTYTTLMVNEILRAITRVLDEGVRKIVVHFCPADTPEYANTVAYPLYGFIANGVLQMETSFLIEEIKNDFSLDIDQGGW